MLTPAPGLRIFLRREATDMRVGIDGLANLTRNVLAQDPLSGHLFVFINRGANLLKALFWERGGYCMLVKRLERGKFPIPNGIENEIDRSHLLMIIDGIKADKETKLLRWNPLHIS
jgi:transposase